MQRKKARKHIGIGMAMGAADIIPGVSGGTIAFISGIYEQLITSIAHIDKQLWIYVTSRQRKKAWTYIQGSFLVQLFGGIIVAIILLAHLMSYLLEAYPIHVFAFFFGLIVASIFLIAYQHLPHHPSRQTMLFLALGIVGGYVLTANPALAVENTPSLLSLFVAGACASIAMILPGISGSYILLLLGKYTFILSTMTQQLHLITQGISSGNFSMMLQYESLILLVFIGGIITGLIGFAKILHRLLRDYHMATLTILVGFMLGSLHTVWPWSQALSLVDRGITLFLAVLGGGIIFFIQHLSTTKKTTS